MNLFWLDASALAKRYLNEVGTPLVNYFFSRVEPDDLLCLLEGIGEVTSILVRRKNSGQLSPADARLAAKELHSEISQRNEVEKIHPTTDQVSASWGLIENHSINSTDAIILRCVLDRAAELRAVGFDLVLLSADERLLKAAKLEGLITFNPETDSQADLDALIV